MIQYYATTLKLKKLTYSRKKTFIITTTDIISPVSGWSSGSFERHSLINYKTGERLQLHTGDQFNIRAKNQELPVNSVLITTSIFNGKPGVPNITCREEELEEVKQWLGVTYG